MRNSANGLAGRVNASVSAGKMLLTGGEERGNGKQHAYNCLNSISPTEGEEFKSCWLRNIHSFFVKAFLRARRVPVCSSHELHYESWCWGGSGNGSCGTAQRMILGWFSGLSPAKAQLIASVACALSQYNAAIQQQQPGRGQESKGYHFETKSCNKKHKVKN